MEFLIPIAVLFAFAAFLVWKVTKKRTTGTPQFPPPANPSGDELNRYFDELAQGQYAREQAEDQAEEQPGGKRTG